MIPGYLFSVANHLWQSTIVAALAALLALIFRNNSARVRYWLWFVAAMKFLIPFSILVSIGNLFEWRAVPVVAQRPIATVVDISMPFAAGPPLSVPATAAPSMNRTAAALFAIWFCGFAVSALLWIRSWLHARIVSRSASPIHIDLPVNDLSVRVMSSPVLMEPAVFGIISPTLVIPDGISDRMTSEQLEAILIHELCHVRRHDNLAITLHMIAETLFWFYPLVRWIGKRLVDERERACDEEVLRVIHDPQIYADGILSICRTYAESPLSCSAGVTGSDLKMRLRAILAGRIGSELNLARKLSLVAALMTILAAPILVGILNASTGQGQAEKPRPQFEAASIKLDTIGDPSRFAFAPLPGGRLSIVTNRMRNVILNAYGPSLQLFGAPDWIDSDRYDIEAKAEGNPTWEQMQPMLQALLEDRFKLKIHRETRELPVYLLTVAKGGPKLKQSKEGSCAERTANRTVEAGEAPRPTCETNVLVQGRWHATAVDMSVLLPPQPGGPANPSIKLLPLNREPL